MTEARRVLLDECVPARLKRSLPQHQVFTVPQMGWGGLKNGRLLTAAAVDFDVLLTVDRNLSFQQNVRTLPLAVMVMRAPSNRVSHLTPLMSRVAEALKTMKRGEIIIIGD